MYYGLSNISRSSRVVIVSSNFTGGIKLLVIFGRGEGISSSIEGGESVHSLSRGSRRGCRPTGCLLRGAGV